MARRPGRKDKLVMAIRHAKHAAWLGAMAVAIGSTLLAADDAGKTPPPAPTPAGKQAQRVEALEILRDLNELAGSLKAEKSPGSVETETDIVAKIGRPKRTVTKTTLDSAAIDAMLDKSYQAAKVVPAKITGDEEFIRRVTLDVTGKLPTPDQVTKFRKSTDKNKRAELIDVLLASPDYGTNWGRYWKDVIQYHATPANPGLVRFPKLEEWLADQFRKNRPWDEVAAEMITATGGTADNGATVMVAAHAGQAVELAGEVSRVFLGVQIQCAQCHDHPTDAWKRNQFHEFAAFFGGIQTRPNRMADNGPSLEIIDRKGRASYSMPDLKDPTKQIPIQPKFFLAGAKTTLPAGLSATQRRALAASYVTGQDNPWFARAFVNRAWSALLGDGFYNPVDDLGPGRSAHSVEVLDALADAWSKGGYDVRWLYRTILNTRAYQREFKPSTTSAGKTPFAANCPSRLRSDQILDALTQALGITFDNAPAMNPKAQAKAEVKPNNIQKVAAAVAQLRGGPRNQFNLTFGVDPSIPTEEILGTIPQALFFMNSGVVNGAITRKNGTVLADILANSPNDRVALEALYLRVLARSPTADEVRTCGKFLATVPNRREAFEDILWALVNSTEFLSRK